ncbi:carboxypeptidase O-like [Epargyreus clarus]|uniref:carboxypeptidase O-like n=1 Tax=Epargyreus clarus TaxID=520877 RepID=UPI003C2AB7CC
MNVTEDKTQPTKGSLRMGHWSKQDKWPKVQKRRLRDKSRTTNTIRLTQMNMMQLDDESKKTESISPLSEDPNINEVLSPYTLKQQMTRIATKFINANITVEKIGRTLEYNDIVLLKITQRVTEIRFRADDKKYEDDDGQKKIIFIVHGLSVMGMYAIDCLAEEKYFVQLVSYYLEHLDKFDVFLIPMANPDGYGFKVETWNKNLSPQEACPGVALDRNFDIAWNSSRIISSCSQQYPGPVPFSEPETRAIRDIMHRYSHKIIAYIHVHAGTYSPEVFKGDAVLYPRGYSDVQTDDDKYIDLKGEIDELMRKASFQVYTVTVETLHNWYGRVTGTSVDYASTVYGIPYAMEFVMQLYEDGEWLTVPSAEATSTHVVVEVWKRVIDVVMNNIWNSFHSNEL